MILENEIAEKSKLDAILMTILGVMMANDIIYIFSVGSTHFTVAEIYSVGLFLYLLAARKIDCKVVFKTVGLPFELFCVVIALSGLLAFITFLNFSLLYRFVVGVISCCICLTAMIDAIVLFDYRSLFVKGCVIGIIVNSVFCVIQYLSYQANIPFTFLYEMFRQDSFHLNVYNFCAQGLFLEPSHMNQFFATTVPVCIGFLGLKKFKNRLWLVLALICCALSTSGTSAVVLVGLLLLLLIEKPFSRYINKRDIILTYALVLIIFLVFVFFPNNRLLISVSDNISKYIKLAAEGSNIGDASNAERVQSMGVALKLIPQNPLGCGWNMVHTLLQQKSNLSTASAFSDILEMTLEIGVLGVGLYLISACSSISACLKLKNREAAGVSVAIGSVLIMETLADYAINPCSMSILAFGMCYRRESANISVLCRGGAK